MIVKNNRCAYAQQIVFLNSSDSLSKSHSLQICQLRFLSNEKADSYDTEYIFPPHEGQESGMSIFITLCFVILNIRHT